MACTKGFMKSSVSGKGCLFYENLFHVVNGTEQRKVICNHLRLIPLDEVQTVFRLSPSLFSQPCRFRRAVKSASFPPGEAKGAGGFGPVPFDFDALCNAFWGSQGGQSFNMIFFPRVFSMMKRMWLHTLSNSLLISRLE